MRFGLCAWSFTDATRRAGRTPDPLTPDGLVELATTHGLEAVELADRWFAGAPEAQLQDMGAELADRGIAVVVDTGGSEVPEEIGAAVEAAVGTAAALGAKVVRTTISRCLEGDRSRFGAAGWREHLAALVGPMQKAAARAADAGVAVGIENHQDICSWELVRLCEQVGNPAFGVIMDCGNALAVGEPPAAFAERVMPYLKHVHLKDYVVHPTPSGWRFVRCPIGSGVVDFEDLVARFEAGAPGLLGCIEVGASQARHVRLLEHDWWATYEPRPWEETLDAIRILHAAEQPPGLDWRTPRELDEPAGVVADYELTQFLDSARYVATLRAGGSPAGGAEA